MRAQCEFLLKPNSLCCSEPCICLAVGTLTPPICFQHTTLPPNPAVFKFGNQTNQKTTGIPPKLDAKHPSCPPKGLRPWSRPQNREFGTGPTSSTTCSSPSIKWAAIRTASTRRSTMRLWSFLLPVAMILRGAPSGKRKMCFFFFFPFSFLFFWYRLFLSVASFSLPPSLAFHTTI